MRQLKREVKIGNVTIGGKNPIAVQTMLNVPVEDIEGNVAQAKRCEAAGCQILRVTCPSAADAKCIEAVKNAVNIPIVADIHFDYKAAIACADVGVDKIRINPGNIGDDDRVKAVVDACQQKNIPIRIGVNGGSLEKHILAKYGENTATRYLLPIITNPCSDERTQYRNAICRINVALKEVAGLAGLNIPLTMHVARHCWASVAKSKNIPIPVISEGMGHDSEMTTQIYLASLDNSVVDNANRQILKCL